MFIVIGILREDPLSTGMLDVFFENTKIIRVFTKREFMYLKIAKFSTASTQFFNWLSVVRFHHWKFIVS
jgi:hypothetical protein